MRPRTDREVRHRDPRAETPRKVVVIGAGITGLVAARELVKACEKARRPVEVVVLEAAARIGGKVRTEMIDDAVVETGPDSFVTLKPEMLDLVKELGLQDQLIPTGPDAAVSVLRGGRLVPLPSGMRLITPTRLIPFAFSPFFSLRAKLRMALEPLIPTRRGNEDESLADFTRRRLGPEALDSLVAPMLAGIFAGDPEKMSVRSTFPQLLEMEKKGGLARSLWFGGAQRGTRREGFSTFMTIKGGLSRVINALAESLPPGALRLDCPATAVRRHEGRWEVVTPRGTLQADAVISAIPASAFADSVEGLDPELANRLREIHFASTATVTLIYDAATFPKKLSGFGFLTARGEKTTLTAATYSSSKFPGRAPSGKIVIRAFVGGAGREESAEAAVMRIESRVREDLDRILGLGGVAPIAAKTTRWIKSNPQYNVGHARRLERLSSCLKSHPGLVLAGCSYGGVGLPDCVRSGRRAAELALPPHRGNMTLFMSDSLSLCIALGLGAIIGMERELSDKAAGLRTNILICVGSCLFMIVSKNFTGILNADPTRIAAQIVTGIGFIGAGAIMHEGEQVTGLTTAATIWVVAAVGMAVGVGDYSIGAFTTLLTLLVQTLFPRLDAYVDELRQRHTFKISSDLNDDGLEQIKTIFRDSDVKVLRRKLMKKAGLYYSEWYVAGPRLEQKNVVRLLLTNPHVRELTY